MQADINYIFNHCTIAFFHVYFPLLFDILFFLSPLQPFSFTHFISLSLSLPFSVLIFFLLVTLSISIYLRFQLLLYVFVENVLVILFFLFFYHFPHFSSSSLFLMLWYSIIFEHCILCSAGHILVSINCQVYHVLTGSLNILFRAFPCIMSISFISFFFMYPYDSIQVLVLI